MSAVPKAGANTRKAAATVAFSESWEEDAQRRDFRINALYADAQGAIHDPTGGGLDDARAGRVIFIGDAHQRIKEDYAHNLGHETETKMAVFGALSLYLNFVNIFQFLLNLMGERE